MKITNLSDGEILLMLENLANSNSVRLTFANKLFYISLLHLCEEEGELDKELKQYYVELSVGAFAEKFQLSCTKVFQSLKLLNECGAIVRKENKRVFRKLKGSQYVTNDAYRTYVNVPIWQ